MNTLLAAEESGGSFLVKPDIGLMVWTLVVFGLTLFFLWEVGFPRIAGAPDKRPRAVEGSLGAADPGRGGGRKEPRGGGGAPPPPRPPPPPRRGRAPARVPRAPVGRPRPGRRHRLARASHRRGGRGRDARRGARQARGDDGADP